MITVDNAILLKSIWLKDSSNNKNSIENQRKTKLYVENQAVKMET